MYPPGATSGKVVQEYTLIHQHGGSIWKLTRDNIKIEEKRVSSHFTITFIIVRFHCISSLSWATGVCSSKSSSGCREHIIQKSCRSVHPGQVHAALHRGLCARRPPHLDKGEATSIGNVPPGCIKGLRNSLSQLKRLQSGLFHAIQGGGIFLNPVSSSAPAKLRLLYECAPLAYIVEAAGGASSNGTGSVLQLSITSLNLRTPISIGSKEQVQKSLVCLA